MMISIYPIFHLIPCQLASQSDYIPFKYYVVRFANQHTYCRQTSPWTPTANLPMLTIHTYLKYLAPLLGVSVPPVWPWPRSPMLVRRFSSPLPPSRPPRASRMLLRRRVWRPGVRSSRNWLPAPVASRCGWTAGSVGAVDDVVDDDVEETRRRGWSPCWPMLAGCVRWSDCERRRWRWSWGAKVSLREVKKEEEPPPLAELLLLLEAMVFRWWCSLGVRCIAPVVKFRPNRSLRLEGVF
ncbi:hypothetical protein BJ166DRAFT_506903, partial [Pestalotiopsis sp. NC0098]